MESEWRAFRIQQGVLEYELDARHGCGLMGVRCHVCNSTWTTVGISYPSIDCLTVSSVDECVIRHLAKVADDPQIMSMEDYSRVLVALEPVLGDRRPVKPGVNFGHLRGEGRGTFGDFAWPLSSMPLVRKSVFEGMLEAGFNLTGVPAALKLNGIECEQYLEIEVPPTARLSPSSGARICEACGRADGRDARIIIDAASFDETIPVQRILDAATNVVVNAPFANFIRDRNLTDITVTPLHVL